MGPAFLAAFNQPRTSTIINQMVINVNANRASATSSTPFPIKHSRISTCKFGGDGYAAGATASNMQTETDKQAGEQMLAQKTFDENALLQIEQFTGEEQQMRIKYFCAAYVLLILAGCSKSNQDREPVASDENCKSEAISAIEDSELREGQTAACLRRGGFVPSKKEVW